MSFFNKVFQRVFTLGIDVKLTDETIHLAVDLKMWAATLATFFRPLFVAF